MNPPAAAPQPQRVSWRTLAWVLGPPTAVWLVRSVLREQADAAAEGLQPLHAATLVADPSQALWVAARPFVLTALAGIGGVLLLRWGLRAALRRWGWPRLRPWAAGMWLLICLGAGAALVASHLNQTQRHSLPTQAVRVLLAREVPASARGPGGAEVYVEAPGERAPLHLLAEQQALAAFAPDSRAQLHIEAGRWWGRWGRISPAASP